MTAILYFTYRNKITCSKSIDNKHDKIINYYLSFNECPLFVRHCIRNFTHMHTHIKTHHVRNIYTYIYNIKKYSYI